jgi:uncharacterized membrane protein YkoI
MLVWFGISPPVASAWAKDGDSSGGSNSGSGSGSNSGSGSDGDDSEDSDDEDDDGDDNSGSGSSNSGKKSEQDRALSAVSTGRAMPLEDAIKRLRRTYSGRVIDVALRKDGNRLVYRFKVKTDSGFVRKVTMDAATGQIRGIFGF